MPYKFNESRRHKIPKARYRVTNWPEYDAALVRRGGLTVWFSEEAVAAWHAPATGERGGQPVLRDNLGSGFRDDQAIPAGKGSVNPRLHRPPIVWIEQSAVKPGLSG